MVGIDDFAIKKRHKYGTVMVNHGNNNIISMINSRDIGEVSSWLKLFPNLKYVSRDGSLIYKSAIELANPNILQISDRFHLIKGLSEAINEEIKNTIPRVVILETIKTDFNNKTLKDKFNDTKNDIENGLSFTSACDKNRIDYRTMKKLMNFNQYELNEYFKDKTLKIRIEKINKKNELVKKVKDLKNDGLSIAEISRQIGIDSRTVSKYLKDDFKFTIANTSKDFECSCTPYHNIIVEMIIKKSKIKEIYKCISNLGYSGKYRMVSLYVSKIKREEKLEYNLTVKRKYIIKLIYNNLSDIKDINRELLLKLYKINPKIKVLIELMKEFKGILLHTRKEKALINFINKARSLNIDSINSFINGLMNDYDAVINSLKYEYSNGVVEASVNKLKLVKRIMHGRCSFELSKSKTMRLEFLRDFN